VLGEAFPSDFLNCARVESLRLMEPLERKAPAEAGSPPAGPMRRMNDEGKLGSKGHQTHARIWKSRCTGLATIRIGFWQDLRRGSPLPLRCVRLTHT